MQISYLAVRLVMTAKQEQILQAAFELFAMEGYRNTPTLKIAKRAKVSEGLIFKHYKNKHGLLTAVVDQMSVKFDEFLQPIKKENNPKEKLRIAIHFPFLIKEEAFNFWKLLYRLKWEEAYDTSRMSRPILEELTNIFLALEVESPHLEARVLYSMLEGVAMSIIRKEIPNKEALLQFLLKRYV